MPQALTEDERAQLRSLFGHIQEQLSGRKKRTRIVEDLTGRGLSRETALDLVRIAVRHRRRSQLFSLFTTLVGWALLGVAFVIVNLALHYGQEWYHASDVSVCDGIKTQLQGMEAELSSIEHSVQEIQHAQAEIKSVELRLEDWNKASGSDEQHATYSVKYQRLVDDYNLKVEHVNALIPRYHTLIDEHNSKVEEYNRLAKSAYSRWYLIPVPRVGDKNMSKRAPHQNVGAKTNR